MSEHDLGDFTIHGVFTTAEQAKTCVLPEVIREWILGGDNNWYMQVGMTRWTVRRFALDELTNTEYYRSELIIGGA